MAATRNVRNSLFRHGRLRLGDRHILELTGKDASLTAVDSKICPNRRFIGAGSDQWNGGKTKATPFASKTGAPYGSEQLTLKPGESLETYALFTDLSVAYVDQVGGGKVTLFVDGVQRLEQMSNIPFVDQKKQKHFLENRKGILNFPYGNHHIRIVAADKPVALLGVFTYDARSNRAAERRIIGQAAAGETVTFSAPFKARPLVICNGTGLQVHPGKVTETQVTFSGKGSGTFEVIGE